MLKEVPYDLRKSVQLVEEFPLQCIDGLRIYDELYFKYGLPKPGHTVVEIGTGWGNQLPNLSKRVGEDGLVYGLDASDKLVAHANQIIDKNNLKNAKVCWMDGREIDLPLTAGVADEVYLVNVFGGLTLRQILATLAGATYVCKPGGNIVITTGTGTLESTMQKYPALRKMAGGNTPAYASFKMPDYFHGSEETTDSILFSKIGLDMILKNKGCVSRIETVNLHDLDGSVIPDYVVIATKN